MKPDEAIAGALCGTILIFTGPVRIFLTKAAANDEKTVVLAKSAHHSFLRIERRAREYAAKLTPKTLEIYDSATVCIWIDTKDLFGGHRILLTLRDGGNECIDARLWG